MKKIFAFAVAALLLPQFVSLPTAAGQTPPVSEQALFASFDEVLEQIVALRRLPLKHDIKRGIKSKDEIRGYIEARIAETHTAEEIALESRLLKRLDLIPAEMDYGAFLLDLMTEQVAGYYDPFSETFYIADWIVPQIQKPVMAHELIHALQDQHYDLKPFLEPVEGNGDRTLARMAVVEGDGFAAMLQYIMTPLGMDFRTLPNLAQMSQSQSSMMAAQFPLFGGAPPFLQESLMFPYTRGALFLQGFLRDNDWTALDSIFQDLPVSTEQILHPEKYFGVRDDPVELPEPETSGTIVYSNVLGEFTLQMVLAAHMDPDTAAAAAAGWDGDRASLIESEGGEILHLTTLWDSAADAGEFCEAYRQVLTRRLGSPPQEPADQHLRQWSNQGRSASLTCRDLRVEVSETTPR